MVSSSSESDSRSGRRVKLLRDSPEAHLADDLNLPSGTIQSDVAIVGSGYGGSVAALRLN